MDQGQSMVLLITEPTPQSMLFVDYIKSHVQCPVSIASPTDKLNLSDDDQTLLLLDANHLDEISLQKWQEHAVQVAGTYFAVINIKDEEHAADLLSFMHLRGVFYRHDSLELICKGIEALQAGNLWMSRSLMARLIEFFRRQQINSYRPACGLTKRELEIIGLLGTGASNTAIADQLFVSEHTVKSHLYNIFRKIDVHNRLQAVNWARKNLGIPPVVAAGSTRKPREGSRDRD